MYSKKECLQAHYESVLPTARNRAFDIVRDHSLVDDVIQETIIKFHKHFDRIEHEKYGAWFLVVATTTAIDTWRRERKLREKHRNMEYEMRSRHHDVRKVTDSEVALHEAVKELPEEDRNMIMLEYWEGFTIAEIAKCLDKTANAVSVRKFRYKEVLREKIKKRLDAAS